MSQLLDGDEVKAMTPLRRGIRPEAVLRSQDAYFMFGPDLTSTLKTTTCRDI